MRIAVIGSGISGLVAAWALQKKGLEVFLFEREAKIGFDGHSVSIDVSQNEYSIDLPSRLLNPFQWPQIYKLYEELGIEIVEVEASQSFCNTDQDCFLRLGNAELFAVNPLQMINGTARKIIVDILRFRQAGRQSLEAGLSAELTFKRYLDSAGYSEAFIKSFLYPVLSSTVCTCSFNALDRYPASILLRCLENITRTGTGNQSYLNRTRFGSRDVVQKLSQHLKHVRTQHEVQQISESELAVRVAFRTAKEDKLVEEFDQVVLATQANQAQGFCGDRWRPVLSGFAYEDVHVYVHRDRRLLPKREKDWATFNFMTNSEAASCSISLQKFYGDESLPTDLFQTINPVVAPDPKLVVAHKKLQRPVLTVASLQAWRKIEEIHGSRKQRLWLAGSYAVPGVPLLESGVASSLGVVRMIESKQDKKNLVSSDKN